MNRVIASALLWAAAGWAASYPIVLSPRASSPERIAAAELARSLPLVYPEHSFPVVSVWRGGGPSIRIRTQQRMGVDDSFSVSPQPRGGAVILGASPRGVLYGAYALLEKLGFGYYLSYDADPVPRRGAIDFTDWVIADEPLLRDRIVFNWHNFLSSASTWELEDWQHYVTQAAKMRYDDIMVHAYGNNPMFSFEFKGKRKPVGYLATTRSGRDWGTQHVNDVRRLIGGEVFRSPVFGASIAQVPEGQRTEAPTNLMQQVFGFARDRGLGVTFALDVDTESANPQELITTLPANARITSGKFQLANPDTPEGYSYYRSQAEQLLKTYPQITRLAIWFRTDRTPWRDLQPDGFPSNWRSEYDAVIAKSPELREDPHALGMFVMSKLIRAYARALVELARRDVDIAAGSWRLDFAGAADRLFPPGVTLMPLDWETVFDSAKGLEQLKRVRSGRKLLPIIWAHHDDRTYIGRPYAPFADFSELMRQRGRSGYAVIHWTTRPLDLYFKSIAEQSWKATDSRSLRSTCAEMAAKTFGEAARLAGGEYLHTWVREGRMFGRETSDRFIDVPLKDAAEVIAGCKRRLKILREIEETALAPAGRDWLDFYRGYERFTSEFFRSHAKYEEAQACVKSSDFEGARRAMRESRPEEAIRMYAEAAKRGRISRGEEALIVSLNLRWLPFLVSMRQAVGLEPVRVKFLPTQHERLAQGAGRNTFFVDAQRKMWRGLGESETGVPAFDDESGPDELAHSGIRIEKEVKLRIGAMMGEALAPGMYKLELVFLARQSSVELMVQESPARERIDIYETQQGDLVRRQFAVRVDKGYIDMVLEPSQGAPLLSAVIVYPGGE